MSKVCGNDIVQHMEPDHSGSIVSFAKAFAMTKNFFGTEQFEEIL